MLVLVGLRHQGIGDPPAPSLHTVLQNALRRLVGRPWCIGCGVSSFFSDLLEDSCCVARFVVRLVDRNGFRFTLGSDLLRIAGGIETERDSRRAIRTRHGRYGTPKRLASFTRRVL